MSKKFQCSVIVIEWVAFNNIRVCRFAEFSFSEDFRCTYNRTKTTTLGMVTYVGRGAS